jgi:ABC-type transport system involved in multi-copper enzyme maturation permease subunit
VIGRVWAIAINTFREAMRNKVLYVIAGLVLLCNMAAVGLGAFSLHEEARVARDVGLSAVSLLGAITAIALGVSLLYSEIQKKTIHVILAKPIHRHEFVLGKYLGMTITLSILCAGFAAALALMLALSDMSFDGNVARAVVLGWCEVLVVASVAIFFSSFSTPYLSGMFTAAVWVAGRSYADLVYAAERVKIPSLKVIGRLALYVVPDLHLYSVSGSVLQGKYVTVHGNFVGWDYVASAAAYGAVVIAILLGMAVLIFRRRDFV